MTSDNLTIETVRSETCYPSDYRQLLMRNPRFGTIFTDHMFTATWREGRGWHDPQVRAREPFPLHPACAALHYAQEIFEGMKAFRTPEDDVVLFRPDRNAARFANSAIRMAMPPVPEALFTAAVEALVAADRDWVPDGGGSLYIRPFMFASEAFLGVRPASEYVFCVIACPVGPYFGDGERAISLWVSEDYVRAAVGGTGSAKCGGNYAASLLAQAEAKRHGCDQVVFLDAAEHRWVEELGGMNVFFVTRDGRLVTPPLGGTILAGITRGSIIDLARDRGLVVEERRYAFEEWSADASSGALAEAFACGTAATVAGIGTVHHAGGEFVIGEGGVGPITTALREDLFAIQRGTAPDPRGWRVAVG